MRALRGEIDFVEITEQRADLVALKLAMRANHAVAGDGCKTVFEAFLQLAARSDVGDLGDHTADRLAVIAGGKKRRGRADDVFAGAPEWLHGEADAVEEIEPLLQQRRLAGGQLDYLRYQEVLALDRAVGDLAAHALERDALVRGVLVDDGEAARRRADEITAEQLPQDFERREKSAARQRRQALERKNFSRRQGRSGGKCSRAVRFHRLPPRRGPGCAAGGEQGARGGGAQ